VIQRYTDDDFARLELLVRQLQTALVWGDGTPEAVMDGPKGRLYEDRVSGAVYRKTTVRGTLTGWVTV
jgi:hypothetical protein